MDRLFGIHALHRLARYLSILLYPKAWVVTNDRWTDHGRHSRQARVAEENYLKLSSSTRRHP